MADEEEVVVSEVDDESEFDEAFSEFAEARDEPESDPIDEEIVAEDLPDPDPIKEEPEAAPAAEEDPYAGMTPEVRAKFEALEVDRDALKHTIDSDAGRVRAYQQKVDGLTDEIQLIRSGSTAGPTTSQIAEAMKGSDDDWDGFTESYPDVAKAIDKRMAALGEATDKAVDATLKPVKDKTAKDEAAAAVTANEGRVATVAEVYPEWTTAVATPEFGKWITDQPQGVANLAESDDTRDASTLIGLYDAHLVASGQPSLKADPPTGVEEDEVIDGSAPTELEKRRKQQLADGESSVASKRAGIITDTDSPDTEFEAAFKVFADRKERKRA